MIESGLHDYLFDATKAGASDLHITGGRPLTIRVHGKVQLLDYPELTLAQGYGYEVAEKPVSAVEMQCP